MMITIVLSAIIIALYVSIAVLWQKREKVKALGAQTMEELQYSGFMGAIGTALLFLQKKLMIALGVPSSSIFLISIVGLLLFFGVLYFTSSRKRLLTK